MDWTHDSISARALKRPRVDNYHHIAINQTTFSATPWVNSIVDSGPYNQSGNNILNPIACPDDSYVQNGVTREEKQEVGKVSADCCYGMIPNIAVKLNGTFTQTSSEIAVVFQEPNSLVPQTNNPSICFEMIPPRYCQIMQDLGSVADVRTQLYCHSKFLSRPRNLARGKGRRDKLVREWFLNIIIYGPENLVEVVGVHFSDARIYLQDPMRCDRSTLYRNPHVFPPESGADVWTDFFDTPLGNLEVETVESGPDLLAQLMEEGVKLPETEAPAIIKTSLFSHQKEALTFLLQREAGWNWDRSCGDIWSRTTDKLGRFRYRNNVSGSYSDEAPEPFHGGILADYMGLGKTLSMISLIAANQACNALPSPPNESDGRSRRWTRATKTTLLIVPPSLIQAWEGQFHRHLHSGALSIYIYHGQNRKEVDLLRQFDVVITTYNLVSRIWSNWNGNTQDSKSIFSVFWHRIVLDEAHTIQNAQSQLAQACRALRSSRRWAISGTPIQNKLKDFASIVSFLRVHPYSNEHVFEEEIYKPWQNRHGPDPQAFLRLKTLVRAITISRTEAVISLPTRIDELHHLDFAAEERLEYEAAKLRARTLFQEAAGSSSNCRKSFNALWLLNTLRMVCNHGLLAQSAAQSKADQNTRAPFGSEGLGNLGKEEASSFTCSNCGSDLAESILGGWAPADVPNMKEISADGICRQCRFDAGYSNEFTATPWPSVATPYGSNIPQSSRPATPSQDVEMKTEPSYIPTKIKALVDNLSLHYENHKCAVFSQWTYTLDLVQSSLQENAMKFTRIDGKIPLPKRNAAIRTFQTDESVRIILVSITCGGAGIDLTAGSRAYLLEPHWNPMVEEQALCRIHRVGQRREVTTIRYLMRDSCEEQIVDIQKRKKMLAHLTIGQAPLSENGIGLGTLEYLKSVLN